jgi:hypothetical protein
MQDEKQQIMEAYNSMHDKLSESKATKFGFELNDKISDDKGEELAEFLFDAIDDMDLELPITIEGISFDKGSKDLSILPGEGFDEKTDGDDLDESLQKIHTFIADTHRFSECLPDMDESVEEVSEEVVTESNDEPGQSQFDIREMLVKFREEAELLEKWRDYIEADKGENYTVSSDDFHAQAGAMWEMIDKLEDFAEEYD